MADFNKQKLMENIYTLIQQKGVKIGELETAIGVSTGYISRLNKNVESSPGVDIIWKIAKELGVSTDALVEGDMSKARDNMRYMAQFLNRLKDMTDTNELEWDSIYIASINEMLRSQENPEFLLVKDRKDGKDMGEQKPIEHMGMTYSLPGYGKRKLVSAAAPHTTVALTGTGYKSRISHGMEIYIFPMIAFMDTGEGDVESEYFDLYMRKYELPPDYDCSLGQPDDSVYEWVEYPLCNTLNNAAELHDQILLLYNAIVRHEDDLKIDDSVRNAIDIFMNPNDTLF